MSAPAVHPDFCDLRECRVAGDNVDHRSSPFRMVSSLGQVEISVGLARFDSLDPHARHCDPITARVDLFDLASDHPDGSPVTAGSDLTEQECRLLAEALHCVADQLAALKNAKEER